MEKLEHNKEMQKKDSKNEYNRIWWVVNHTMIFEITLFGFSINKIPKLTIFQVFNPKYKAKANYIVHFFTQKKNPIPLVMAMYPNSN